MDFDDPRWSALTGGYRLAYDPRAALRALETGEATRVAWEGLWENLHHQGDVGEASYAAVPHLVRIYAARPTGDWNTYALAATIEDVRGQPDNPPLPGWLEKDYDHAWRRLFDLAIADLPNATDPDLVRSLVAVIAHAKKLPVMAKLALFEEAELEEILAAY
jgi:hypothetical protein